MSKDEIIISLLREIEANLGNAGGGGSGGGLTSEGAPGNIPMISEDGKTLEDGLVSVEDLKSVLELLGSWDEETWISDYERVKNLLEIVIGTSEIPVFNPETQYVKGDICIFNGVMYRFTEQHIGIWNEAHVINTNFYREFVRYYSGVSNEEHVYVVLQFAGATPVVTGELITVSYNGNTYEYALDSQGKADFTVEKNTPYSITFPDFAGYTSIPSKSFIAVLDQREVAVAYVNQQIHSAEVVTIYTSLNDASGVYPTGSVMVTYTETQENFSYNIGEDGICTFEVPYGTAYSVSMPLVTGYVSPIIKYFTANLQKRTVKSVYINSESGIFYVDTNGVHYTFEEWVEQGKQDSEAMFLFVNNEELVTNNASFYILLEDLKIFDTVKRQWLNQNITVPEPYLPLNGGTRDFGVDKNLGPRSNLLSLKSWLDEQKLLGNNYTSGVVDYLISKDVTDTNGNKYLAQGPLTGTISVLLENWDMFINMLDYVGYREYGAKIKSVILWTLTQVSAASAWTLKYGSLYSYDGKSNSICVLPFYAL